MITTVRHAERSVFTLLSTLADTINRDSPMTLALVFSRVAASGPSGVYQSAVQKELDLSPAAMSRAVNNLVEMSKGKPGLGLVRCCADSITDGRVHILRLTEKGRALADEAVCHLSNPGR